MYASVTNLGSELVHVMAWCQAAIGTNADELSMDSLGTNFGDIQKQNTTLSSKTFENVVFEVSAILFRSRGVKTCKLSILGQQTTLDPLLEYHATECKHGPH